MREHGVEPGTDSKSGLRTDHAYALNTIWNIDKHRRLPELAWAAEGPVWFEEVTGCRWWGHVSGVTLLPDGGVLGELRGLAGSGRPQAELHYTIDLVLTDDPSPLSITACDTPRMAPVAHRLGRAEDLHCGRWQSAAHDDRWRRLARPRGHTRRAATPMMVGSCADHPNLRQSGS